VTVLDLTKSTFESTVRLTLKTKSTLEATLHSTLNFLARRKTDFHGRQKTGRGLMLPFPAGATPAFSPVVAGNQEIRLAANAREIDAAQALRYRVFYNEMGAMPLPEMAVRQRDFDHFDTTCEHLLVLDRGEEETAETQVVGTYRLMRREHARKAGGFYTASEFDISKLVAYSGVLMELGRSCVDADYRDRATMQLLWRGLAEYITAHNVDIMFGCASLPGTDPAKLAMQLSYLYHYHMAPEALRPTALPGRYTNMNLLPKEAIDPKRALASLPPLLKGYLRVGGFIGDGAVVDHQFNTTDVCIIVKTDQIADRYTRHYDLDQRSKVASFKKAS